MAIVTTNKLVVSFGTVSGTTRTVTISEVKPSLDEEDVSDVVNTLVASTHVFDPALSTAKSAKLVATTTTDLLED